MSILNYQYFITDKGKKAYGGAAIMFGSERLDRVDNTLLRLLLQEPLLSCDLDSISENASVHMDRLVKLGLVEKL